MQYADLYNFDEDSRIKVISHRVIDHGDTVAFLVEDDAKADRYMEKLKTLDPRITEVSRGPGPIEGVIYVKVKSL